MSKAKITKTIESTQAKRFTASSATANGLFKKQWYLKSGKTSQLPRPDINASEAWKTTKGNRKIVVAVIDGGFDLSHPDFNLPGKIVFPTDYVKRKKNQIVEDDPGSHHGSMCAGVAVAESNGKGILGIANGCSFMPVCIPTDANNDLLIKVFEETALHADVISCSWAPPPVYAPLSDALYNTLKKIAEKGGPRKRGSVICFSASNYNAPVNDPDNQQFFWLDKQTDSFRITRGPILNGYAAHPNIIAVSASTSFNKKAAYSNWGKEISVCAPSDNYHPLVEGSNMKGRRDIWTTKNKSYKKNNTGESNGYTKHFGGTSCATALVAGVAALVLSVNEKLSAVQVKKILEDTADKIEDTEPDMISGNQGGVYINGHSVWFGYGKINAAAAVKRAKEMIAGK